uniref:Uncharacterized protein n=1 Tax=uncultured bacterium fosmid pJB16B1 TaxID=1478054 RepID=A0A0H3UA95_9BACT|nr:hypothetical protein [uncultured bacterium fosmid pJB16B1]
MLALPLLALELIFGHAKRLLVIDTFAPLEIRRTIAKRLRPVPPDQKDEKPDDERDHDRNLDTRRAHRITHHSPAMMPHAALELHLPIVIQILEFVRIHDSVLHLTLDRLGELLLFREDILLVPLLAALRVVPGLRLGVPALAELHRPAAPTTSRPVLEVIVARHYATSFPVGRASPPCDFSAAFLARFRFLLSSVILLVLKYRCKLLIASFSTKL